MNIDTIMTGIAAAPQGRINKTHKNDGIVNFLTKEVSGFSMGNVATSSGCSGSKKKNCHKPRGGGGGGGGTTKQILLKTSWSNDSQAPNWVRETILGVSVLQNLSPAAQNKLKLYRRVQMQLQQLPSTKSTTTTPQASHLQTTIHASHATDVYQPAWENVVQPALVIPSPSSTVPNTPVDAWLKPEFWNRYDDGTLFTEGCTWWGSSSSSTTLPKTLSSSNTSIFDYQDGSGQLASKKATNKEYSVKETGANSNSNSNSSSSKNHDGPSRRTLSRRLARRKAKQIRMLGVLAHEAVEYLQEQKISPAMSGQK